MLAALRKEKPDKNKIRLKCSIKNIIEAMSLYRCEYEENDDLLEKYYEYNKALNAFFELEITDDKEEVHPKHGRLLYTDENVTGMVGKLYEDGTYVMKSNDKGNMLLDNPN